MRLNSNRLPFIALASLLSLAACGSADEESSLTGAFNKSFDESWSREFVGGCVSEAVKFGASEADSRPICECLRGELEKSLDGVTEKMNPPPAKLEAAAKVCMPGR